ncbi:hypothetical protein RchiOBHm_Chr5g0034781 [Rosa chinensis]|uniref:Uncharacterized protein n=1 Tax=Rosa chinensis TaxID=74649 RepID=A0A2P6QB28_ROSCH|nr:hypothetical protein RchiOBHm_Chr5g0034781 [Rosa chinensis]
MEEGENSKTTFITREKEKPKIPVKKALTGRERERNSQRFVLEDNLPRIPIFNYGIWLNLDQALNKRKTIDQWVNSLMMTSALTIGKFEAPDLQVYYVTILTGVAKKYYFSFKETKRGREWL